MSMTGKLIVLTTRQSARRFERATLEPERVQREILLAMMDKNKDTEYGRRHGFGSVRSIADYQRRAPVVTYDDIRAEMNRVLQGEKNIFTAEDPVMFAQTSGTTGEPKFIPVTPTEHGRAHQDIMRTWIYHSHKDHPTIFDGKIVTLVSPAVEGHAPSGVPFGSTSGHMYKNIPALVRRAYAIPYPVFEIEDYSAKYYAIMRLAMAGDVTLLCTANPSSVLKMCEKGDEYGEAIIRDIRDGTLSRDVAIEPGIRGELERHLRPDSGRARFLEQARSQRGGVLRPSDYWPRLALIGCWKGGTVGHYIDKFDMWFDPDGRRPAPVRDWGYLASEMRGSVPLSDQGSQGALTVATNFFEFVQAEELAARPDEPAAWNFRTIGEVEDGQEYYIFVTTPGGLYRYDINDIIQVQGYHNRTPQVVFVRKGRGMTNLTGEKLSVNQVIEAFARVSRSTGLGVGHFKAEADGEHDRYLFRIEPLQGVTPEKAREFLGELDRALKEINVEYKAKRNSLRLKNPVLHVMREGWHERERRRRTAAGQRLFQAKTEVLSPMKLKTQEVRPEIDQVIELEA